MGGRRGNLRASYGQTSEKQHRETAWKAAVNGSYQGTNAEVAFILEYGSPRIGATHFMENTAEESEQEVYNAMDAELTQILRERGL